MWKSPGLEPSQCASMAAILIGWCLSVFSPCWSPISSCSGARMASKPDRHPHHGARLLDMAPGEQVARADREHDEAGGEVGGVEHVGEAIGEARIEDDRRSSRPDRRCRRASRGRSACASSCWRTRIQKAEIAVPTATTTADSTCSQRRHAVAAEQQDAEERRLEEERGQHLVADQRADDVADDAPRSGSSWCRTGRTARCRRRRPCANETAKILVQNRASRW